MIWLVILDVIVGTAAKHPKTLQKPPKLEESVLDDLLAIRRVILRVIVGKHYEASPNHSKFTQTRWISWSGTCSNANHNGTASEPSSLPLNSNAFTKSCLWYSEKSCRGTTHQARHWRFQCRSVVPITEWNTFDLLGKTVGTKTAPDCRVVLFLHLFRKVLMMLMARNFSNRTVSQADWFNFSPCHLAASGTHNLILFSIVRPLLRCEINLCNKCVSSWLLSQWDTHAVGIKTQTSYHEKYSSHPKSKAGDNQLAPNCLSTGSGPAQCRPALNGLHFEHDEIFPRVMHCCPLLQSRPGPGSVLGEHHIPLPFATRIQTQRLWHGTKFSTPSMKIWNLNLNYKRHVSLVILLDRIQSNLIAQPLVNLAWIAPWRPDAEKFAT